MMVSEGRKLRHEYKYAIDMMEYHVLRSRLAAVMQRDEHARENGRYHIRSLYFDDFRNSALFEKESGTFARTKYRLRIYNLDGSHVRFERKNKLDQYVNKESAGLSREEAEKILAGDIGFLAESGSKFLRTFYINARCNILRPKVIVDYEREAFVHPVGNVRITFDTNLSTGMNSTDFFSPDVCTVRAIDEPGAVLEIKYDNVLPSHIRGLLPHSLKPRSAIGKFVISRKYNKYNAWEDQ